MSSARQGSIWSRALSRLVPNLSFDVYQSLTPALCGQYLTPTQQFVRPLLAGDPTLFSALDETGRKFQEGACLEGFGSAFQYDDRLARAQEIWHQLRDGAGRSEINLVP